MPRVRKADDKVDALLDELLEDYSSPEQILGEQGLLKQLTKRVVERALKAELSHHLSQESKCTEPESASPIVKRNSRNGYSRKPLTTEDGQLPIQVPRDRQGSFEPLIVPKGERRLGRINDQVLALYARGMSTRDIQAQLEEI